MNDSPETRLSLLHRVREGGGSQAWEEFVSIYEPLVYHLARRRGLQDADAREISQDVLVAVAGAIDRWEPTGGVGSFRAGGEWPENCQLEPVYGGSDTRGIAYDGLVIRLEIKTPSGEFKAYAMHIATLKFGR